MKLNFTMNLIRLFLTLISITLVGLLAGCDVTDDDDDSVVTPVNSSSNSCGLIGLSARVIGGTECGDLSRSSVVRISGDTDRNPDTDPVSFCTGSMISSSAVVTAAHCFLGARSDIFITFGDAGSERDVLASSVTIHPDFSPFGGEDDRAVFDIAVLRLAEEVNLPVLPLLVSQTASAGSLVGVFGYGQTVVGDPDVDFIPSSAIDFNELVAGEMTISNVTDNFYFVENVTGTNVCFGDSGGPLVFDLGGTAVNLGVVSQGSVINCSPGDVTSYTRVSNSSVSNFLLSVVPDAAVR